MSIPNVFHFVFGLKPDFGNKPFGLVHYLAIKSAVMVNKPDKVYLWYKYKPSGIWWDRASQFFEAAPIDDYAECAGVPRDHHAHRTDLARLTVLLTLGGIYLDADVICVRPFTDLLHHKCVMGWEDQGQQHLCNAVILAEKHAKFIQLQLDSQKDFRPGMWGQICITRAGELAKENPDLVHTPDLMAFHWPTHSPAGIEYMHDGEGAEFPEAYCHHLWEQIAWPRLRDLTPEYILSSQTNFCRIIESF